MVVNIKNDLSMKELNRTDKLTIAVLLMVIIFIIGLVTVKKPAIKFSLSAEETSTLIADPEVLEYITITREGMASVDENPVIIDLRGPFEFQKSTLENAINIPIQDLLLEKNLKKITMLGDDASSVILYGTNPLQTNGAWMLLKQLGVKNLKIYTGTQKRLIEEAQYDFRAVIEEMGTPVFQETVVQKEPVITIKRQKKTKAEGGC